MSALFGGSSRSSSKNLVEFKAGKMNMKGKMVHPDKRKGQVYVYQSEDDLMHFCWKDRTSGHVEEDLIIIPDDVEYKRVKQCTTGRVYVLSFKSSCSRYFYWMQEPKTEKDDDHCRKINDVLNNPPGRSGSSGSSAVLSSDLSNLRDADIQRLIGNISQHQLMQFLGNQTLTNLLSPESGIGGSGSSGSSSSVPLTGTTSSSTSTSTSTVATTSSETTSATSVSSTISTASTVTTKSTAAGSSTPVSSTPATLPSQGTESKPGPIHLSDLQNILSGISVVPEASSNVPVDLGSVMTAEALQPILTNQEFVDQLRPFLPPTGEQLPPVEQLRGTVTSPQFQQAVSLFSSALQSGQLGPLVKQFGLGDEAVLAASCSDMEAFIKALGSQNNDGSSKDEKSDDQKKDKDDDDFMAVD